MELREMRRYKKHYRRLKRSVKEMTSYQIYLTTPYRLQSIMYKIKPVKCLKNSDLIKSESKMMMRLPQGQFKRKVTSILNYLKHPYIHKAKRSLEQLASQDRSLRAMWFIRRIIHYYQPFKKTFNRRSSMLEIRRRRQEIIKDRRKITRINGRDLEKKKELLNILKFRIISFHSRAKHLTTALYNKILNKKVPPEWKTKQMSTETEQKKVNNDSLIRYDKMENEKLIKSIIYLLEKKQCSKATTLTSLLYRNIVKKISKNETKNRTVPNRAAELRGKQVHHRQVKGNISNLKERIIYVNTPRRLKFIIQELREKRFHRNVTRMIKHEKAMLISSGDARFRKEMLNVLDLLQENKTTHAEKLIETLVANDSDLLTAWFLSRFKDYVNYKMWHFWHCVKGMVSRDYDKIMKIKETNLKSKKELLDILKIIFSNRNKAHGMITALFERLSKTVPKIKQVSEKKIQDTDRFLTNNLIMVENIMLLLKKKQCGRAIVSTRILYMKLVGAKSKTKNKSSLQIETLKKGHQVSKDKNNVVKEAKSKKEYKLYTMYCLVYLEDMVGRVNRDQPISSPSRHLDDFLKKHNTFKYHKSISGILHLLKKKEVKEAMGLIKLLKNRILPSVETKKNPKKNRRKRSAVLQSNTISRLRRILTLKSSGLTRLNRLADNLTLSEIGITKRHYDPKYRYAVLKILKNIINDKDKRASYLLDNFSNRSKQQVMNLGKPMKESVSESRTDNHIFNKQHNGTMNNEKLNNVSAIPYKSQVSSLNHNKNEKQRKIFAKPGKLESSSNYNRNNHEFYQKLPKTITLIVRPNFNIYLSGKKLKPLENSIGNNKIELKNRYNRRLIWEGKQRLQHEKEQNHIDEVKHRQENRKNDTNRYRALIDREKHNKNTKIENETAGQHKKANIKLSKLRSKKKMTEPKNKLSSKRQKLQKSQTTEGIDPIDRIISELTSIVSMQESKNYEKAKTAINAEKQKVKNLPKDLQRKIATVFQAIEEKDFFRARHLILKLRVEREFKTLENIIIQEKKTASGKQIKRQNKNAKIENETGSQNKTASRRLISTKDPKEKNKNAKLENETGSQNKKVSKRFKSNEVHKEKNKNANLENETGSQNKKASRRLKSTEMTSEKGNSPTNNKHLRRKPKMRITLKEKNKQTLGKEKTEENHQRPVGLNSPKMVASRLSTIIALKENKPKNKAATALIKKERGRLSRLSNVVRQKVESILNYIRKEEYNKAKLLIIELEKSEVSPTVSGNDRNTEDNTGVHGAHAVQPVESVGRKEDSSA
ncbi:calponin homology domain-containing protein DDB_G0272472-like isoform X1 [Mytilus californianus]|uniref:calponin homology domain-containing protein DDB_G0272472-like isoform X1 n=1 Tax=Mytilus californianus TaxID=6549 RepID=UPI002247F847|nr:calponin homology domain-containing protein DDB_G0272472-like isoform X1 [Mytilus californianus]